MWTVGTGFPNFQTHYYKGYLSIIAEVLPCSICAKNANPTMACRWKIAGGQLWLIHDQCLAALLNSPKSWAWHWEDDD